MMRKFRGDYLHGVASTLFLFSFFTVVRLKIGNWKLEISWLGTPGQEHLVIHSLPIGNGI
jgi:hypothetical protein